MLAARYDAIKLDEYGSDWFDEPNKLEIVPPHPVLYRSDLR